MKPFKAKERAAKPAPWAAGSLDPSEGQQSLSREMITIAIRDYLCPESAEHKIHAEEWIFDEDSTDRDERSFPWCCKSAGVNRENILKVIKDERTSAKISAAFVLAKELNCLREGSLKDEPLRRRAERSIVIARSGLAEIFGGKP